MLKIKKSSFNTERNGKLKIKLFEPETFLDQINYKLNNYIRY